jgi:(p)ppGpp synthase/HD superfamily hydrolase
MGEEAALLSVSEADALAERAHGDDRNRSGVLFIDYVRSVAARMLDDPDPYAVPAALLHDAVEKAWMSWDDLRAAGADDRLIDIIDALTERPGESEESYFVRVTSDQLSLRIKFADIADKLDLRARSILSETDRQTLQRRAKRRLALLEQVAADHQSR